MRHFPIFMNVQNRRILVTGGGECAIAKLRLLLKTEAEIVVFSRAPENQIEEWDKSGLLTLRCREIRQDDFYNTAMVYAAEGNETLDAVTAAKAKMSNVLFNIVDNLQESEFITPAIVDRDPVTVAIGTEGTAPVLARKIKSEIEESLPVEVGRLAKLAEFFRPKASKLPSGRIRRDFWSRYFYEAGPKALKEGGNRAVGRTLNELHRDALKGEETIGCVALVGAGPGDPDLLTRKALKLLHEADVVIHDRLVSSEILELCRREATMIQTGKKGFGLSWKQEDINALMVEHARQGAQIVRLKSGDPTVFGRVDEEMSALDEAGIEFEIVPGITTASAAAASINVSLTKRQRNSALQIMTAQDVKGFAEQDWRRLAEQGAVAAIYMGLKSSHLLSGRLLMHGIDPMTPVTVMENVSRQNQKTIVTSIAKLGNIADEVGHDGPVIIMLGLEPRSDIATVLASDNQLIQAGAR